MTKTEKTNRDRAELAVERALECAFDNIVLKHAATLDVAKRRGLGAAQVFIEQIDNTGLAFAPDVVELAHEWVFYAGRFGVVAEIHNGLYDDTHCAKLALAIIELDRKLKEARR